MKNILSGLAVLIVCSLTACGSLAMQGELVPVAEVTQQAGHLIPGELQSIKEPGNEINTLDSIETEPLEVTESLSLTPTTLTEPLVLGMPVAGWSGYVISLPAGAQFDDYFMPAGDNATQYGIDSALADPSGERDLADEIEALRDSGKVVLIWCALACDVPDVGGCQIVVWKIETDDTIYEITPMPAAP